MKYTGNTIKINFIFILCIILLFCAFFAKLAYVSLASVVEGTNLKELADSRTTATKVIKAERGRIYDSSGNVLAQNVNSYTVVAMLSPTRTTDSNNPKHVVDKEMTARSLSEILIKLNSKMTYEYIYELLNKKLYQVELGPGGRNISEYDKQRIAALNLPGIVFEKSSKRYYQNADFASYIIGYAKKDSDDDNSELKGYLGIEGYCDRYLKGTDGSITYQKDAYGYQMADKVSYTVDAKDGLDVYLTLDKQVQIFLDNAVADFKEYDPSWVTLTVADAKTGAIIGSSTTPSFNPNKLNIENYNNPLTSYTYEPGSTMKIFSFASAIEEGEYKGDELYKSGTVPVADYVIKDWNKVGWGKISYDVGFTYSSNVAAVNLSKKLGKKRMMGYYEKLGFGSKTNIELSNELAGDIEVLYDTEVASASYGQGITVTPIQMVQALTTITNKGTLLKPYIIEKIVDPNSGEVVYQGKRTELSSVYSEETVNKIIELMDLTVNGEDKAATGKVYSTPAVRLIGKTGTANYAGSNGKYVTGSYNNIRSFAGVFPKDEPEYIIYIAVKDFKGSSKDMGGIIKSLVESVAKYRNLDERESDKDDSKIVTLSNYVNNDVASAINKINTLGINPIIIGDGSKVIKQYPVGGTKTSIASKVFLRSNGGNIVMPNMYGWSSKEVVDFCNVAGVKYELNGYGYVKNVNINEGEILNSDSIISVGLQNIEPEKLVDSEALGDEDNKKNN